MDAFNVANLRSVNQQEAWNGTSGKYAFIPTTRVLDVLAKHEWLPVKAGEKRTRKPEREGFQSHMVRLRRIEDLERPRELNQLLPEIVLKNSHDGGGSFQLLAGLFRMICMNGMVVADATFQSHRIKHIGYQDQNVVDAIFDVVRTTPMIMDRVENFRQVTLNHDEQTIMAESALIAKYGADTPEDIEQGQTLRTRFNLERLITPIRNAETLNGQWKENTLWNVTNTLQEKLVEKGGRFAIKHEDSGYQRNMKARAVTSVTENIRINQAIWALAEKMRELKA